MALARLRVELLLRRREFAFELDQLVDVLLRDGRWVRVVELARPERDGIASLLLRCLAADVTQRDALLDDERFGRRWCFVLSD